MTSINEFSTMLEELESLIVATRGHYFDFVIRNIPSSSFISEFSIPEKYILFLNTIGGTPLIGTSNLNIDILPGQRVLPFEEALTVYNSSFWNEFIGIQYFPLLADFFGDYIALENGAEHLVYISKDDIEVYQIYDSFDTFIQTLIQEYRDNLIISQKTGLLDGSTKKSFSIGRQLNPNSDYWNA